jgi:hypothetical protein
MKLRTHLLLVQQVRVRETIYHLPQSFHGMMFSRQISNSIFTHTVQCSGSQSGLYQPLGAVGLSSGR